VQLAALELTRKAVPKDGACLFRCISEGVYGTQKHHMMVRQRCVDYMRSHQEDFEPFVFGYSDLPWDHYLFELKKVETWGGYLELQVLSLVYKVNFVIYSNDSQNTKVDNNFPAVIMLAYTSGNHYDMVYTNSFFARATVCQGVLYDIVHTIMGCPPSQGEEQEWKNVEYHQWTQNAKKRETKDLLIAKKIAETKPNEYSQLSGYHKKTAEEPFKQVSTRKSRKHNQNNNKNNNNDKKNNKKTIITNDQSPKTSFAPVLLDNFLSPEDRELQEILKQIEEVEMKEVHTINLNQNFPVLATKPKPAATPETHEKLRTNKNITPQPPSEDTAPKETQTSSEVQTNSETKPSTDNPKPVVNAWKSTRDWNQTLTTAVQTTQPLSQQSPDPTPPKPDKAVPPPKPQAPQPQQPPQLPKPQAPQQKQQAPQKPQQSEKSHANSNTPNGDQRKPQPTYKGKPSKHS